MTKEERDKREAEKRARMEGSPDIGGVTLPFSRNSLLKAFWALAAFYPAYMLRTARGDINFETLFAGSVLFVACMLPGWLWCTGRIQGLPIFPLFALGFLPTYVTPLWQGHSALAQYTANEINTAAWTVAGFLLIGQLFWQQMAVRAVGVPHAVRMIDLKKSGKILIVCLFFEVVFELIQILLWQHMAGGVSAIRGFATAAGRMGIFVFSYQLGQGELKPGIKFTFLTLLVVLIIQETASLLLANVLPTLGIAFAAYVLGSGKIPWKALATTVVCISVLHAGKYEMRDNYLEKPRPGFLDLPGFFTEWVGLGIKNLGMGKKEEEIRETSSAAQRASLLQVMMKVQANTPDKISYLQGETYAFIPSLLIPRVLSPKKTVAHLGNMMLALRYGFVTEESMWFVSVAFDPIIEAYANYGFVAVAVLAVVFGFFIGWATRLTIHVPMLSFGFLFGVQVVAASIASFNTTAVYITSVWQAFLALVAMSFVLMRKGNNPVWKYYALKLAEKLRRKGPDPKLQKTLEEVNSVLAKDERQKDIGYGISDMGGEKAKDGGQESVVSGRPTSISENPSTVQQKHERPTRFVYGEKKK